MKPPIPLVLLPLTLGLAACDGVDLDAIKLDERDRIRANVGRFQPIHQGARVWLLDTTNGEVCLLLAAVESDWGSLNAKACSPSSPIRPGGRQ